MQDMNKEQVNLNKETNVKIETGINENNKEGNDFVHVNNNYDKYINNIINKDINLEVISIIDEIKEKIHSSSKVPFTNIVAIDYTYLLDMLEKIESLLPKELNEAYKIVNAIRDLMYTAELKADKIIEDAKKMADQLVNEHEILVRARTEADIVKKQATEFKEKTIKEVNEYVYNVLSATESGIVDILTQIQDSKKQLPYNL